MNKFNFFREDLSVDIRIVDTRRQINPESLPIPRIHLAPLSGLNPQLHPQKCISESLQIIQIERNMIVLNIFLLIMYLTE